MTHHRTPLGRHLLDLEQRARLALAILNDEASDDDAAAFRDLLDLDPADDGEHDAQTHDEAFSYVQGGLAFTPDDAGTVLAVLAWGGPTIQLVREGDSAALIAWDASRSTASRRSAVVDAWAAAIDEYRAETWPR